MVRAVVDENSPGGGSRKMVRAAAAARDFLNYAIGL